MLWVKAIFTNPSKINCFEINTFERFSNARRRTILAREQQLSVSLVVSLQVTSSLNFLDSTALLLFNQEDSCTVILPHMVSVLCLGQQSLARGCRLQVKSPVHKTVNKCSRQTHNNVIVQLLICSERKLIKCISTSNFQ